MATTRLERLLKLIRDLETGDSKTVETLARAGGVSRRTVFRDLKMLDRAGLRYTYDRNSKRYSIEHMTMLPPLSLTHSEVLALLLMTRNMEQTSVNPDSAVAASAGLKMEGLLPPDLLEHCDPIVRGIDVRMDPTSDATTIVDTMATLQFAVAARRKVRVSYDSYHDGRAIDDVLHIFRLAFIHRGWYVIAMAEQIGEVRTFKVERILRLAVLDATYEPDPEFTLDKYFGNAWSMIRGDKTSYVRIRFSAKVAGNVEEIRWHKTQRTTFTTNGTLIFEVDVDGLEEISWWILGYGDQAEVLEPQDLRDMIAERARRMYAMYHQPELTRKI